MGRKVRATQSIVLPNRKDPGVKAWGQRVPQKTDYLAGRVPGGKGEKVE